MSHHVYTTDNLNRQAELRSQFSERSINELAQAPQSRFIFMQETRVLINREHQARLHEGRIIPRLRLVSNMPCLYLGRYQDMDIFALQIEDEQSDEMNKEYALVELRSMMLQNLLREIIHKNEGSGVFATARSLFHWHKQNRFCSKCGQALQVKEAGWRLDCQSCDGYQFFPRTDPAVIMLIINEKDECLLANHTRSDDMIYSTLAGFLEPGETIEAAVRREVFEETSVNVGPVIYMGSQPWPFPANLMIGCYGKAKTETIHIDETEIRDCRWFSRQDVELMAGEVHPDGLFIPPPISISRDLIDGWLKGDFKI